MRLGTVAKTRSPNALGGIPSPGLANIGRSQENGGSRMPTVAETKERVQAYLTRQFDTVSVDADGDYSLAAGSTRVFVGVMQPPTTNRRSSRYGRPC